MEGRTLDKEKFRYYLIQDYLYIEEYAKARSPERCPYFQTWIWQMDGVWIIRLQILCRHAYMFLLGDVFAHGHSSDLDVGKGGRSAPLTLL